MRQTQSATDPSHYQLREMANGIMINGLLSAAFAWLVFGSRRAVALWGLHGLALDFVPQTFVIALMSVIVPSLIARRRLAAGLLRPIERSRPSRLPRSLAWRALLIALLTTAFAGGIAVLVLRSVLERPLSIDAVYALKVSYGVLIGIVVTPIGLRAVLTMPRGDAS
jgi:hypothetical protein